MFAWHGQDAGDVTVGFLVEQVANRQYGAAGRTLEALADDHQVSSEQAARLNDLLSQAQRLADDQDRLAEVVAGLAYDEQNLQTTIENEVAISHKSDTAEPAAGPKSTAKPVVPPEDALIICLLGPCQLQYQQNTLDCDNGDRAGAVLRFLAAQPERGIHKEQLAAVFWPDADDRAARRSLHQVIYNLRRRLTEIGAEAELRFHNNRYVLGGPRRWRDVDEVDRLMALARSARDRGDADEFVDAYEQAEGLLRGDYLHEHPYAEWADAARQHYRQVRLEVVDVLLNEYQDRGQYCRVVDLGQRYLQSDPTNESVARHLMRAHAELGQSELVSAVFTTQSQLLTENLGVPPDDESEALVRKLIPRRSRR